MMRYAMGTFLRARVDAGARSSAALQELFSTVDHLEARLSFFREDSDIFRVNRAAGRSPVTVSAETFAAVALALRYAQLTDGAFDPAFRSCGCGGIRDVQLDSPTRTVFLPRSGMVLDLGGIGKGFALDLALARLREGFSLSSAAVDFGGQWLFYGEGPLRETVVIEDPRQESRSLSTVTIEGNASVSTSSQAQRPGHLRDPFSGRPAAACLSATAIAPTAAQAEALSTALFVLGPSRGEALLPRFPGARAVLH